METSFRVEVFQGLFKTFVWVRYSLEVLQINIHVYVAYNENGNFFSSFSFLNWEISTWEKLENGKRQLSEACYEMKENTL